MLARRLLGCGLALALLHPLCYWGYYAGDGVIHLVYGEHAAAGRFFEYNLGEKSAGVTSPGFMLVLAALFRALPHPWVPYAVKAINLLGHYALLALVYRLGRKLALEVRWAAGAAIVVGLTPGLVYNATIGMENGIFATALYLFFVAAEEVGWFAAPQEVSAGRQAALGALLALVCWLRPEGLAVAALVIAQGAWRARSVRAVAALALPVALGAAALVGFHFVETGHLMPTSAKARALLSWNDSVWVGPVPLNPRLTYRLGFFVPVFLCFLAGLPEWCARGGAGAGARGLLLALFGAFFALYSTVLASGHISRYAIFLMPVQALVAASGARALAARFPRARAGACVAGAAALLALAVAERVYVIRPGEWDALARAAAAQALRPAESEAMLALVGRPAKRPVVLAYQEVQARWWLDERFVIRSLDGRVDPELLAFVRNGYFDHPGYLRARGVDFLMQIVNYNREPADWSLEKLADLAPGASARHDGVGFTRVADGVFRVDR